MRKNDFQYLSRVLDKTTNRILFCIDGAKINSSRVEYEFNEYDIGISIDYRSFYISGTGTNEDPVLAAEEFLLELVNDCKEYLSSEKETDGYEQKISDSKVYVEKYSESLVLITSFELLIQSLTNVLFDVQKKKG